MILARQHEVGRPKRLHRLEYRGCQGGRAVVVKVDQGHGGSVKGLTLVEVAARERQGSN